MKKILLFGRSSLITKFQQEMKVQIPIYDSTVEMLKHTGISIDDPDCLEKIALFYTKDSGLSKEIKIGKQLDLVGKWDDYKAVESALESLTYPFEVYSEEGKKKYIEDNYYEYADTAEEVAEYNKLKKASDLLESLQIPRNKIRDVLSDYNFGWNPYDTDQIEIPKRFLIEGINIRKEKENSASIQAQRKSA